MLKNPANLLSITLLSITLLSINSQILFIITDDMEESITTSLNMKNLNFLKSQSTTYTNAYIQYPVCGPSRSSILSGLRPDTLNNYNFEQNVENQLTIPSFFKNNGYQTISLGKTFHNPISSRNEDIYSDHWTYRENGKSYVEYTLDGNSQCSKQQVFCQLPDKDLVDYKITSKAISLFSKLRDTKWFMAVGYRRPHWDIANPKSLSYNGPIEFPNRTMLFNEYNLNYFECNDLNTNYIGLSPIVKPSVKQLKIPSQVITKLLQEYYTSYLWIDKQIGRLFDSLKSNNMFDSTIIVFLSDNGFNYGDHGLWCKNTLMPKSIRTPLIIKNTLNIPKIINDPVEAIDIFPTLIKLQSLTIPKILDGVDISTLGHKYAFSQYARCQERGQIQKNSCTTGTCKTFLRWMGYTVIEIIDKDIYQFIGWWPFTEIKKCPNLLVTGHRVNFSVSPVDILLLKNGIKINNELLIKKYIAVITSNLK